MKAIVQSRYGSADNLELREVDKPTISDGHVLVRVMASSVNSADIDFLRGWALVRMAAPLRPAHRIPGSDIAGIVEAVGADVTSFEPGSRVLADTTECGFSAFAEYISVPEQALMSKPDNMTFAQAAVTPSAAVIALQGLNYKGTVQRGQRVLINGAGGGMGTFVVQMARAFGAEVTAVDSAPKLEMLRSTGADKVIDYASEDFTDNGERYDLVLDLAAFRPRFDYRRTLAPNGRYIVVGGSISRILHAALVGTVRSMATDQRLSILPGRPNRREDLATVLEMIDSGSVRPVIDSSVPLRDAADAVRRVWDGHALGRVIVTMPAMETEAVQ